MKRYYCPDLPATDRALLFGTGLGLLVFLGAVVWAWAKILSYLSSVLFFALP